MPVPHLQYTENEFNAILTNYKAIFGESPSDEFNGYAEVGKKIEELNYLPFLCSDYSSIDYEKYKEFESRLYEARKLMINELVEKRINNVNFENNKVYNTIFNILNEGRKLGMGLSFGLNKFLDELFFKRNFSGQKLLIIIGHDWYPLFSDKTIVAKMPKVLFETYLQKYSMDELGYNQMFDVIDSKKLFPLFLNLVPGFRKPFLETSGKFLDESIYKEMGKRLLLLIDKLAVAHEIHAIVTWGKEIPGFLKDHKGYRIMELPHPVLYRHGRFFKVIEYYKLISH